MTWCRCPIFEFVYDAPVTLRMLPSESCYTRKITGFRNDFNDVYRCITDSKNVAFGCCLWKWVDADAQSLNSYTMHRWPKECCLRMLPVEMSWCRCPMVDFLYDAPVNLRMLPSENHCTHKVIGFVHDFKDWYRCITDSKNIAFGSSLWKWLDAGAQSLNSCMMHQWS